MYENLATISLGAGFIGLVACLLTYLGIAKQPAGTPAMQELAGEIRKGAMAFLKREYLVLLPFLVVVSVLLGVSVGRDTGIAYMVGGLCSIAAGWAGMTGATAANVRTSEAARSKG